MLRLSFYAVAAVIIAGLVAFAVHASATGTITPQDADVNKDGAVTIADAISVLPRIGQLAPPPTSYCNLSGRDFTGFWVGGPHDTNGFGNASGRGSCSFARANFTATWIVYADFTGDDFTDAVFTNGHVYHSTFDNAILVGLKADGVDANRARFVGANLTGADLSGSIATCPDYATQGCLPGGLNFSLFGQANLTGANLSNVSAYRANFSDANLTNATLSSGQTGPVDSVDAFYGASFGGAITTGADVSGVIWNNTICPDGSNSDSHGNTCIGYGF